MELTTSTIIIPANSVTAPDVNLAYSGPLRSTNVSFKIPNGSIAEFDKKLREAVPQAEMLDITYDDNGYEVIMPSLKRTQVAAVLLCGIGGAALLAVIIFLLYFFIVKEARRTAIERGLGMSRRQCYISLVSGILVLALAGAVLGTGLGLAMIGRSDLKSNENEEGMYSVYSTQYSDWTSKWSQTMEFMESDMAQPPLMPIICAIPGGLVLVIFLLAMVMVRNNLKAEPIELLGGR
ncbi:MAG: FtsX-like permease family protein [Acutalibacter sp.]|uniref:FtsX-like permease family protein n=1 Tax=Acutalibacter sp. TaxID=1918636 RepID=UPI0021727B20|nr:FtsX-like permease family protein [Acutalibacter sp.]MCI9225786.1 FtsX-like permease family protein [Acutalibacter sp.]